MRRRLVRMSGTSRGRLCLLVALLLPSTARADSVTDYQIWVSTALNRRVPQIQGMHLGLELDARALNTPRDPPSPNLPEGEYQNPSMVFNVRPSIGARLHDLAVVHVAVTYQPQVFRDPRRDDVHELRLHEELDGDLERGRFSFAYRTRVEQRHRVTGAGAGQWAHRFRQRLLFEARLMKRVPLRARVYDEVMFHLNDTDFVTRRGFDQNRAFAGLSYESRARVETVVGYMNAFTLTPGGTPNQLDHVLWITIEVGLRRPASPEPRTSD